ncbi:efflux RND transporter periplasmic adaptor subunit [Kiritimatiellota bacterium B12222]|nr:efflux RND transporter periplasmic adaptor subunit [Kiritimatiellota bacterium B12222]
MFSRIIFLSTVLCGVVTSCLADSAASEHPNAGVEQVSITPELKFRARSIARETDPIVNPLSWAQFKEMTPEGTRVKKGDMIFHLDITRAIEDRKNIENSLEETKNQVAQKLAEMQKTVSNLEDTLAEKQDAKKIQVARLNYLKSLPIAADVKIAEGRLEVSKAALKASKEELEKSKLRLEKQLISPAMLIEDEENFAEQMSRTAYAETMLAFAQQPANPTEIELVEYQIRNLDLEIQKVADEIPIKKNILEIESQTQYRKIDELTSRINDKKAELSHEYLYAPADGVLMYAPRFKRDLVSGIKASKGMVLAVIPRRDSMAFEGEIPEQLRHIFNVGDPAEIQLNLSPSTRYQGKIASISPFSRDAVEGDNPSGVKVVDLVIEMEEIPQNLPLGVYSWVTLKTKAPITGWAVPASWIRYRGGKAHVSVEGQMEVVNGIVSGDQFLLSSPHPPREKLQAEGEWTQTEDNQAPLVTDQFMVTGELAPYESEIISTPRVRARDIQIEWLSPENTFVEKGATLVKLDSEQLVTNQEKQKMDVDRFTGERKSAEKELAIRSSEKDFQLSSAENRIEIKKRERDLIIQDENVSAVAQALLNLTSAKIQKGRAEVQLNRSLRNAELTSRTERITRERELKRTELALEKAQINYDLVMEGPSKIKQSQAQLDLLKELTTAAELKAQHNRTLTRAQSHLRWRISQEEKAIERLERLEKDIASMEITAPVSGLVKYMKIWDGVRNSKIKPGYTVWRGMPLLTLSSAQKLFVEVQIPERYIHYLEIDMPVSVRIPSEGGLQWSGTLIHMEEILEPASRSSNTQSLYGNQDAIQEQVLRAKILINTGEENALKPGAIAQIIFPFEK